MIWLPVAPTRLSTPSPFEPPLPTRLLASRARPSLLLGYCACAWAAPIAKAAATAAARRHPFTCTCEVVVVVVVISVWLMVCLVFRARHAGLFRRTSRTALFYRHVSAPKGSPLSPARPVS